MKLTDKQYRFVSEYLIDCNATRAAKAAGYGTTENSSAVAGSELLRNPKVAEAVKIAQEERAKRAAIRADAKEITKERWLDEVTAVALSNITDLYVEHDGKLRLSISEIKRRGLGRLIRKIKTLPNGTLELDLHAKQPALELLGKHMGWVKDQVEHSGSIGAGPGIPEDELKAMFADPETARLSQELALRISKPKPPKAEGEE